MFIGHVGQYDHGVVVSVYRLLLVVYGGRHALYLLLHVQQDVQIVVARLNHGQANASAPADRGNSLLINREKRTSVSCFSQMLGSMARRV